MLGVDQEKTELTVQEPEQFNVSPELSFEMEVVSVFHAAPGDPPLLASFPVPELT